MKIRNNKNKIKIFILAAGLGERLRPITYHIPKPLLPILGRPLIERIIEKISLISSDKIGINLHYKADMMREWGRSSAFSERLEFFYEEQILGTGGALKNAEGFLSGGHFLVHNSDVISDIDILRLIETHFSEGNIATLATHDYPKYNNVVLDDEGYVIDVENAGTSMSGVTAIKRAYTGVAVYSPEILKFLPEGVSHVTTAWLTAIKAGHKVRALDFTGCYWNDVGTPQTYASQIINSLRSQGETVFISPHVDCSHAEIDGYVSVEGNCTIKRGATIRNCIILEGSCLETKNYENCVIGPDFEILLDEMEMIGFSGDSGLLLIGAGGSDRKYYRQKSEDRTQKRGNVVIVKYSQSDPDFHRQIEYTRFFRRHGIPVPELFDVDFKEMTASFEDLGDVSLYSWLRCHRDPKEIEAMYRKVMDILIHLHTEVTMHVSECLYLQERIFDYEHFRWESDYFIERFVKQLKGMNIKNISLLNEELHRLAQKADSFHKTVIHRDFQSQNIMVIKGTPRLIDYQGARIGPPAYDVASILWDPYFRLEDCIRIRLFEYYFENVKNKLNANDLLESLPLCRIQRHMQALGAYAFLSMVKGKKFFLKHVPEGLRLLKEDIKFLNKEYPILHELIERL